MNKIFSSTLRQRRARAVRIMGPLCAALVCGVSVAPGAWMARAVAASADYVLGVGDTLQVTVTNHPDVNGEVVVRPDGKITLPGAGEVTALGVTAPRLAREIEKRLARTLNNARVQVTVKAAAPRQASIAGAVRAPGLYTLKPGARVLDLIAAAGGPSTKISRISGTVVRRGKILPFALADAYAQPGGAANLPIKPEDLVQLDAQDFTKQLTVSGQVTAPGTFDLDENLTVPELLAQAGGPRAGAALRRAHVLRDGKPISLDLSEIQSGQIAPDSPLNTFRFQPGDVLMVPENTDRFGVQGEVVRPSFYSLPESASEKTVVRALSLAGGPQEDADLANVTLTRTVNGQTTNQTLNVGAMIKGTAPDNIVLRPDDVLFVPRQDATVSVIGPVAKPGAYPFQEGDTLLDVLAKTGSPTKDAALRRAYVLRDGVQMPIDLRPILNEGAIDPNVAGFRMQKGDILTIPESSPVYVSGAVMRPGAYVLSDDLNVISLLAQAGNGTPDAALSQAYILRKGIQIPLDLNVFLSGTKDKPWLTGFKLAPGDTLIVPENKVFYTVLGQVAQPGLFAYPDNPADATVLRALARAGGPTGTGVGGADLKDARILRDITGQVTVIEVDLNALFQQGKPAQNLVLRPNDVLFIPTKGRGFNLSGALGAALALRGLGR